MLVIHRTVTACNRLNLVVKIDQNFVQRQLAMQHDAARIERLGMIHLPAFFQNQLQNVADAFIGTKDVGFYDWLANFFDQTRIGKMRRIID